jgi:hypothetical protein
MSKQDSFGDKETQTGPVFWPFKPLTSHYTRVIYLKEQQELSFFCNLFSSALYFLSDDIFTHVVTKFYDYLVPRSYNTGLYTFKYWLR